MHVSICKQQFLPCNCSFNYYVNGYACIRVIATLAAIATTAIILVVIHMYAHPQLSMHTSDVKVLVESTAYDIYQRFVFTCIVYIVLQSTIVYTVQIV